MTRFDVSIRWKMTLLSTGLLAVLIVSFGLFLFFEVERLMISSLDTSFTLRFEQALRAAPTLAEELAAQRLGGRPERLPRLESLSGSGVFLQISDRNGRVVAASSNLGRTTLPAPKTPPSHPGQVQQEVIRLPVAGLVPEAANTDLKEARFLLRSSLLVDGKGHAVGLLEGAQSLFLVDEVQDRLVETLAEGIAVALLLAILGGLWLAGQLLRPLARMTQMAQQIGASHDLSQRLAISTPVHRDEVGRLAVTFNAMLERLETAFLAQKRFVADASHELKTPLTAILGHANFVRRHGKRNPEQAEEAIGAILEQAERMHRLTVDLLALARAEESKEGVQEVVSLAQVAQEAVKELTPLAQDEAVQLTVTSQRDEATFVLGERDKLKQVVINLVDNALTFTPAGGRVSVGTWPEMRAQKRIVVLEVRDSGCGIAPTDVPHIFERFYRVDKARTRAEGGSGLGLTIVREVVTSHGGEVEVSSQPGLGSTFRVRLPARAGDGG